jgi:hypothetical protein
MPIDRIKPGDSVAAKTGAIAAWCSRPSTQMDGSGAARLIQDSCKENRNIFPGPNPPRLGDLAYSELVIVDGNVPTAAGEAK